MHFELLVNGVYKVFRNPEIRRTVTFGASGIILASAIYRMSKSRYKVYVIVDGFVWEKLFMGVCEAVCYLKELYSSVKNSLTLRTFFLRNFSLMSGKNAGK